MKKRLFEVSQEKIENQFDILSLIRTIRKVDALEKLLISNLQSTFIPVMRENVIQVREGDGLEVEEDYNYYIEDKSRTIEKCLKIIQK